MDSTMESASSTPTTKPGLSVGEVRARVLADHAKLRAVIAEVDRLALAVASDELTRSDALRAEAAKLYQMLLAHMDHEDEVLAPIIRQIDAWGLVRHEQMQSDHAQQRTVLAQAIRDLATGGPALGQAVQSMCWEILHDMKREEHDLLHPDLWREDVIVVKSGA
jgi:iron-sulfur cluster repair protein YtfE (RIC family)